MKGPVAVSPRFPAQRSSAQGESVPKARPKGVVDGKLVNIPVPLCNAMGGRRRLRDPAVGIRKVMPVQACRRAAQANPGGLAEA